MESLRANGGWGGPPKLFLSSFFLSFFFLSFRTGDGLGFIRFCSWDVSEGGPALGSGGLGGGLGGLSGFFASRTHEHGHQSCLCGHRSDPGTGGVALVLGCPTHRGHLATTGLRGARGMGKSNLQWGVALAA